MTGVMEPAGTSARTASGTTGGAASPRGNSTGKVELAADVSEQARLMG